MSTGIYAAVKQEITTRQAAEHYGYHVNRYGMMCCPFHRDKHPSMKVDRNFICFGCQEKGDVIRFVSRLYGMSSYDSALKLVRDFNLEIGSKRDGRSPPSRKAIVPRRDGPGDADLFEKALKRYFRVYGDYISLLRKWEAEFAPRSPEEDFHPLYLKAVQEKDRIGYCLDLIIGGPDEEKAKLIIDKGKEVRELERRIDEYQSGAADGAA